MSLLNKKITWLLILVKASKIEEAFFQTSGLVLSDELPKEDLKPIHVQNGVEFYETETLKSVRNPTIVEMLKHIMSQPKISLVLDKKTINIYPMSHIESVKDGKVKILGYFDRVSAEDFIAIKYKNGENTVYGEKNSAIVKFLFARKPSFRQIPSSLPDKSLFEIVLENPLNFCERKKISIKSNGPSIGKLLVNLALKTKNQRVVSPFHFSNENSGSIADSNTFLFNDGNVNLKLLKQLSKNALRRQGKESIHLKLKTESEKNNQEVHSGKQNEETKLITDASDAKEEKVEKSEPENLNKIVKDETKDLPINNKIHDSEINKTGPDSLAKNTNSEQGLIENKVETEQKDDIIKKSEKLQKDSEQSNSSKNEEASPSNANKKETNDSTSHQDEKKLETDENIIPQETAGNLSENNSEKDVI